MRSLSQQFRQVTPVLLIAYLISFMMLLAAIAASSYKEIPLDFFTKDPNAITDAPFYLGILSNVGIMLWSGSIVLCFFGAYLIRNQPQSAETYLFLILSGLLSLMLALDDLLQLHEHVFPSYFRISDNAVYLTYTNLFLVYFIRFRKTLLDSEFLVYGLAFFFLGLSTVIDLLPLPIPRDTFLEDAIKLLGIVSWLVYFFRFTGRLRE